MSNPSWRVRILAILAIGALAVLLIEGACFLLWRVTTDAKARLFVPHPDVGYLHEAGVQVEYRFQEAAGTATSRHTLSINSKGLRDVERTYEKPDDVRRVLVLGDSMVFGHQVPQRQRFTDLLERRLDAWSTAPRYQVLNAGVDGYGTVNELLFLRREGYRYEPDVVVLTFCMFNDLLDNHRDLARKSAYTYVIEPYFVLENGSLVLKNHPARSTVLTRSYAYRQLAKTAGTWTPGLVEWANRHGFWEDFPLYGRFMDAGIPLHMRLYLAGEYDPDWQEAWEITRRLLVETRDEARRLEARFMVLVVPSTLQMGRDSYWKWTRDAFPALRNVPMDLERPSNLLDDWLARNDIPYIDLLPVFRAFEQGGDRSAFFEVDIHLRPEGHAVVAEVLGAFLRSHGWLAGVASSADGNRLAAPAVPPPDPTAP